MFIHAWMEMGMRMDVLVHGVDIYHTSMAVTSLGMLRMDGNHDFLSR